MTVVTPMTIPRVVRKDLNLWALRARRAWKMFSLISIDLLVSEGGDRVEFCRLSCRPDAEDKADKGGESQGKEN